VCVCVCVCVLNIKARKTGKKFILLLHTWAQVQIRFFAQHIVQSGDNPYKQSSCTSGRTQTSAFALIWGEIMSTFLTMLHIAPLLGYMKAQTTWSTLFPFMSHSFLGDDKR
jgi:hypothetical protein